MTSVSGHNFTVILTPHTHFQGNILPGKPSIKMYLILPSSRYELELEAYLLSSILYCCLNKREPSIAISMVLDRVGIQKEALF